MTDPRPPFTQHVDRLMRSISRHRERYLRAWIAATGVHPTEAVWIERPMAEGRQFYAARAADVLDGDEATLAHLRAEVERLRAERANLVAYAQRTAELGTVVMLERESLRAEVERLQAKVADDALTIGALRDKLARACEALASNMPMSPGKWKPFYLELHDERPDVYRVVDGAAAERFRRLQTTARPPYIALVWGRENAMIIVRALTEADSKPESAPVTLADEARCSSTVECIDCHPIKMRLQPDGTQHCGRCGLSWSAERGFYDHAKPEGGK